MAVLHPFKAWHPAPEDAKDVSCPPYDVVSTKEARALAEENNQSFLHVVRPEIDLAPDAAFDDPEAYAKGAENLRALIQNEVLKQDEQPAVFIYRLTWKGRTQTGIFGCVSVQDYDEEVILKHELTRPAKEDDRTRHITEQQAHAEPVMLTCDDTVGITPLADAFIGENEPLFDFDAGDGIRHQIWRVSDTDELVDAFAGLDHLYIADGHHRCKSASRAAEEQRRQADQPTGDKEYNFFPAVIFPMSEMEILPYNRVVGTIPDDFWTRLNERFDVTANASAMPSEKGLISLYSNGMWHQMRLPETSDPSSVEKLDAYRLQKFILEPMIGIKNPRTDHNISFVGGIRGTGALEERVDSGEAQLAISMYPTAIEELIEVSDDGLLMPPKSTWFEPKLRSGLLVHTF